MRWPTRIESGGTEIFGVRVRAASRATPRSNDSNGDPHALLDSECARAFCARADNRLRSFAVRRAARSAQRIRRRTEDFRHATDYGEARRLVQLHRDDLR